MKLLLKCGDETLGFAETQCALTDPPMGCGEIAFDPSAAYAAVERLFRDRTLYVGVLGARDEAKLAQVESELSKMRLVLVSEAEELLEIAGFTIYDCRRELPDEGLKLEFLGMHHEQFERLFPGHYEKYEASLAAKA